MSDASVRFNAAPAAATGTDTLIRDTTTQTFARDVLEESRRQPVLVDFWAPWCGPCRTLSPIIEKSVRDARGKVKLVKMNIDDHPAIANQLGIQSIPAVIAFVEGKPVDGFIGAQPESQVKAFIEKLGKKSGTAVALADLVAEADALLEAGDTQQAAELYAAGLQADPEDVRAIAGLARATIAVGDLDNARQILEMVPAAKAGDPALATARAQLALAEETGKLGDPAALQARLAADANDHDARFALAMIENARGNRSAATDLLLEIMRKDRTWNEDKARKQLVQFFEAWGPKDEATLSGRRRLSSLLFA